MVREVCWVIALVALALTPQAAALDARGSFSLVGDAGFPAGTTLDGAPLAAFVSADAGDDGLLVDFRLTAPLVTVRIFEKDVATAGYGLADFYAPYSRTRTFPLHDVTITLMDQKAEAYVGADLSPRGSLHLGPVSAAVVEARDRTVLTPKTYSTPTSSLDQPYYYRDIAERHILATASGTIRYSGPLALKTSGLFLVMDAEENITRLETGMSSPGTPAGIVIHRWVVLEAEQAVLEATAARPWATTFTQGNVAWAGEAAFTCRGGVLTAAGKTYRTGSGAILLAGDFAGTLLPEGGPEGIRARLSVEGDLATTSMATTTVASTGIVPLPDSPLTAPWLLFVGGTVLAAGVGAALLRRRQRRSPTAAPSTPEDCVKRAHDLIQAGYYTAALRWLVKARRLAPTSASVCATQAFVLGELGKVEEALQTYLEASRLDPGEGEHALSAARLAHKAGRPAALVEDLLEQALARNPRHVEEIDNDGFFESLAGRSRFDHLVERAWRRHARELSGPEDVDDA